MFHKLFFSRNRLPLLIFSVIFSSRLPLVPGSQGTCERETCGKMAEHFQLLKESMDEFSLGLYQQIATNPETSSKNLFMSPLSISSALLLAYLGAKDNTKKEIEAALHLQKHFAGKDEAVLAAYGEVLRVFVPPKDDEGQNVFELALANKAYIQKDITLKADYQQKITNSLHSEIGLVDFRTNTEAARQEVNSWVEKQTHDKIKDLLAKGTVDASTLMVLVNAIYFKADWLNKFAESATTKEEFINLDGKNSKVDLMHIAGKKYQYFENTEKQLPLPPFQMIELPYKANELSMLILLPQDKSEKGLIELEKSLTVDALNQIDSRANKREVELWLPRFKLEESYDLGQILQKLGIRQAFSGSADFSGIAENESLKIDSAVHKAFVEVNEKGTEAAAATAMMMTRCAMPMRQEPPAEFRADHPFVFAIRHQATGLITFLGRVAQL